MDTDLYNGDDVGGRTRCRGMTKRAVNGEMMNAMMIDEIPVGTVHSPRDKAAHDAKLKKACSDFESIFLQYLLKSARNTLPENNLFENTHESKMYKSMMDEKLAVSVSRGRGTGLAKLLYEDLAQSSGQPGQEKGR